MPIESPFKAGEEVLVLKDGWEEWKETHRHNLTGQRVVLQVRHKFEAKTAPPNSHYWKIEGVGRYVREDDLEQPLDVTPELIAELFGTEGQDYIAYDLQELLRKDPAFAGVDDDDLLAIARDTLQVARRVAEFITRDATRNT